MSCRAEVERKALNAEDLDRRFGGIAVGSVVATEEDWQKLKLYRSRKQVAEGAAVRPAAQAEDGTQTQS